MAAPKIRIKNSFGTTQIDETWQNYGFREVIAVPFSLGSGAPSGINYQLDVVGTACLIAVRSSVLAVVPMESVIVGSTFKFTFRILGSPSGPASETIYFYVFDVGGGPYSNFGIKVVHQGNLVFHSDMDVMKVPDVLWGDQSFFGTSGRIYAPLWLLNPIRSEFVPGFGFGVSVRSLLVSGADIISTDYPTGFGGVSSAWANNGQYAAVDVTGL